MSKTSPPIPPTGGSFVVDAKGKLVQREKTLGPLVPAGTVPADTMPAGTVPAHDANRPKPIETES